MRYKSDRPGGDQERESEKVDQHEGYIDPDLFFDPLPQPYRMISKLFDVMEFLYCFKFYRALTNDVSLA